MQKEQVKARSRAMEKPAVSSETDLTVSALCLILVILETANP